MNGTLTFFAQSHKFHDSLAGIFEAHWVALAL